MTVLAVSIVDSFLTYQSLTCEDNLKQRKFFSKLAEQLIDNDQENDRGKLFKDMGSKDETTASSSVEWDTTVPQSLDEKRPHGIGIHLIPVKDKNPKTGFTAQNRCRAIGCRRQVTLECSFCYESYSQGEKGSFQFYCCKPDKTDHWNRHMEDFHGLCLETTKNNK